jgi:hypothetical protein
MAILQADETALFREDFFLSLTDVHKTSLLDEKYFIKILTEEINLVIRD